jgi:signal transduction histidine kinase
MQAAPQRDVRADVERINRRADEVGQLGRAFSAMMGEIAAKRELERHMLQAERLASIGQLTASIAHEVNNPLGGMFAAIENRRLRGALDEPSTRTLDLLERGLQHIHDTVQALLNEARSEMHPLAAADLHDLAVLLQPEADHARCRLTWEVTAPMRAVLPAVPVRQVLLNLALNALAAAGARGQVRVWSSDVPGGWQVRVANSGSALTQEQLDELMQGRERSEQGRLGLGVWITARILHTLGGSLRLEATPGFATTLMAEFTEPPALYGNPAQEAI